MTYTCQFYRFWQRLRGFGLSFHYILGGQCPPLTNKGNGQKQFSPEGILPKKLGRGVRSASQNPHPIYDQNLPFSLPCL